MITLFLVGVPTSHTYAYTHVNGEKPLKLLLRINKPVIKYGKFPKLELIITNESKKKIKILDITNRPDLQDNYGSVVFYKGGSSFSFNTTTISDPGAIGDNDFIELSPNENIRIILSDPPHDPRELRPGKYEVNFGYHSNPNVDNYADYYESQRVGFTVKK